MHDNEPTTTRPATSLSTRTATSPVSATDLAGYRTDGFLVIRGMLDAAEVADIKARFDELAQAGDAIPGHWEPRGGDDPLDRFPRVMHPHRFDPKSRDLLIDPRFREVLRQLLDDDPLAVQTMFYFKPPGSRGQAFHQDNYYLRVQPFNCIAAWIAIDPSTPGPPPHAGRPTPPKPTEGGTKPRGGTSPGGGGETGGPFKEGGPREGRTKQSRGEKGGGGAGGKKKTGETKAPEPLGDREAPGLVERQLGREARSRRGW